MTFDSALETIKQLAKRHGDEATVRESQWLADRVRADELTVLVAGQFKRGKSTLLNALIGEELLPTGVLPLTSVATMIHYGTAPRALVSFRDGGSMQIAPSEIGQYVTEIENPGNHLRVVRIDVELPVALLDGIRLVDTPGIGSTFTHNSKAAREALREADLAILVVAPEPPIGEAEILFAREVRDAAERLFVVYNKADILAEAERELVAFTEAQLQAALGFVPQLFVLSAREALQARKTGAEEERFARFLAEFRRFLESHRHGIRERSLARKCASLSKRLETMLRLKRYALLLPIEERLTARARFERLSQEVRRHAEELQTQIAYRVRIGVQNIDRVLEALLAASRASLIISLASSAESGNLSTFERDLELAAAHEATSWLGAVSQLIDAQMRQQAENILARVAELENELLQRGLQVVHLHDAVPHAVLEAFELPGISLPKERIADTGLEIALKSGMSLLPRAVRSRMLRRQLAATVDERLDARRGRLRYFALRELDRAAKQFSASTQRRLVAAETAVRTALDDAANADEASIRMRAVDLECAERTLDQLAADLAAEPSSVS